MVVNLLKAVPNETISSSFDKILWNGKKAIISQSVKPIECFSPTCLLFSPSRVFGPLVLEPRLPFLLGARSSRSTNYKGGGDNFPIGVFVWLC